MRFSIIFSNKTHILANTYTGYHISSLYFHLIIGKVTITIEISPGNRFYHNQANRE